MRAANDPALSDGVATEESPTTTIAYPKGSPEGMVAYGRKQTHFWDPQGPMTWHNFVWSWLGIDKPKDRKDCGSFVAGELQVTTGCQAKRGGPDCTGLHRNGRAIVSRWVLALDADSASQSFAPDAAVELDCALAAYTTWSHTPENPRWRLLAPLSRPVDVADYNLITRAVMAALGEEQFDPGSKEAWRLMHRPSTRGDGSYRRLVTEGDPLDVDEWLARAAELELSPPAEPPPHDDDSPMYADLDADEQERLDRYFQKARAGELEKLDNLPYPWSKNSYWDQTTFDVACNLREFANSNWCNYTLDEAYQDLLDHAPSDNVWGEDKHDEKWLSSEAYAGGKARRMPERGPTPTDDFDAVDGVTHDPQHQGQLRMAKRMVARECDRFRYVYGLGWHVWDGARWAPDRNGAAMRAAVDTLEAAYADLAGLSKDEQKELLRDIHRCESAAGLEGMLKIAGSRLPLAVSVDQLDADPFLFNTANGTLDLRTGKLLPHDPTDLLTKVAGCGYDPDAESPTFTKFLEEVLPDPDVRAFVGRVFGQALEGRVTEHLLPIFSGAGANGKSTLLEAVSKVFGSYAIAAEPDLLVDRGSTHTTGQTDLLGVRLATCSETDDGRQLAASTVKRLTGGDTMRARRMRQDNIEWTPSHSIIMATNHRPQVAGDDPAMWRRLRVVPFDVVFNPPDTTLGERLALELPAILAWAVRGHADWKANGMADPAGVAAATASYKNESDDLGRFLEEACTESARATVKARVLFNAWQNWCAENGEHAGSEVEFAKSMTGRGYEKKDRNDGKIYLGLGLRSDFAD